MNSLEAALISEKLELTIVAQGPDKLWVDSKTAIDYLLNELHKCYVTIADLHVDVDAALESARNYRSSLLEIDAKHE